MKVNRELNAKYRNFSPEDRKLLKKLSREYHRHAAQLIFNGYALGVMAGLGDSISDRELYSKLVERLMPGRIRPYFNDLVLEKLPSLIEQFQEKTEKQNQGAQNESK